MDPMPSPETAALARLVPRMEYGALNIAAPDTTPGAQCWAAPPCPVDDYLAWLRVHYRATPGVAARLHLLAKYLTAAVAVTVAGPYGAALLDAARALSVPSAAPPPQKTDTPGRSRAR